MKFLVKFHSTFAILKFRLGNLGYIFMFFFPRENEKCLWNTYLTILVIFFSGTFCTSRFTHANFQFFDFFHAHFFFICFTNWKLVSRVEILFFSLHFCIFAGIFCTGIDLVFTGGILQTFSQAYFLYHLHFLWDLHIFSLALFLIFLHVRLFFITGKKHYVSQNSVFTST